MDIGKVITDYIKEEVMAGRPPVAFGSATNLVEEEIIDSLGIFSLVSYLEDYFNITIEPEDVSLENFSSVDAMEALVTSKQPGGSGDE